MKNKNKRVNLFFLFLILLLAGFFGFSAISAVPDPKVIINEIQISGGSRKTTHDFVELYNPSTSAFNLKGLKLVKRTQTGQDDTSLKSWTTDSFIPAQGFYLWANSDDDFADSLTADASTTASISNNTGIALKNSATDQIIDSVGWGIFSNIYFENSAFTQNPPDASSIERINFQDTDNNSVDFNILENPTPLNSSYSEEADDEEMVCNGNPDDIILNEIYPNTTYESKEFVEVANIGEDCVDVSGWSIKDSTDTSSHKTFFPENTLLEPDEYFYVEKKLYLNNDADTVYLLDKDGLEKDKHAYEKAAADKSFSFDGAEWQWTSLSTPGAENEFEEEEKDEDSDYVASDYAIRLNEILPNPKGDEKFSEYIELYNGEDFEVNLENWILQDLSSTNFTFPEGYVIKPGKYLTLYRNIFKFALNNTGKETVSLLDPAENTIASTTYTGAKENVSYNFNGALWKWSKFLTPDKENKFNAAPEIKIKKIKEGYVGIALPFEASAKDKNKDKLKYTWDFGDGHKSYLQKASHAFKKAGRYTVALTVDDGSEEAEKTFTVKIKKYPKLDADIVRLLPNPAGNDAGQEWIEIKNNSKKEINLRGWKIATGQENLINHPILKDFRVSAGKIARLTRENALFYLNNKTAKIELRYPDGKTADAVSYSKKKIGDDEIYAKLAGGWAWISSEEEDTPDEAETPAPTPEDIPAVTDYDKTAIQANLGKFTSNPELQKKKENQIILAGYPTHLSAPKPQGRVLGASIIRESENFYTFTPPTPPEKHWALIFWESIFTTANSFINKLFLQF